MPKSIIGTGNADGLVKVSTTDDVVLSGYLYQDGQPIKSWSHQELISGAPFTVEEGHTYEVIVNAVFQGGGRADVTCEVGSKTKIEALAGDAEDDGFDLEIAQFHIYP